MQRYAALPRGGWDSRETEAAGTAVSYSIPGRIQGKTLRERIGSGTLERCCLALVLFFLIQEVEVDTFSRAAGDRVFFKSVAILIVGWLAVFTGCELGKKAPPPKAQIEIENLARWYQKFCADNRVPHPPNEDAFVKYIEKQLQQRGETMDRDMLMVSPRDKKPWVVVYGKPAKGAARSSVIIYEAEGYDGKKLVAFDLGRSAEVDDAELQNLLTGG